MRRILMVTGPLLLLGALVVISVAQPAPVSAKPYFPLSEDEVLEALPAGVAGPWQPTGVEPTPSEEPLQVAPLDPQVAATRARAELRLYQASADPRYLGRAEAALGGFWDQASPPEPIRVLRARVRQSNHEFDAALNDLNAALILNPGDDQALLDRASIETVVGQYDAASRDCRALEPLTPPLYSAMCRAAIAGVTGAASSAYDELSRALVGSRLAAEDRCWVESLMGELSARLALEPQAERHFRSVLAACPSDTYTRGALADLLLDAQRAPEVIPLLTQETKQDALLLRLVIAERAANAPGFPAHFADLEQRFAEARLRGNQVHRREEARFELTVRDAPEAGLSLAMANFAVQREPADVRIALECAVAARQPARVRDVVAFVAASHLEDPRVAQLLARLGR